MMKEEGLEVKIRKVRKYSSYKGKISPAVPNEVQRDFHSEKPDELLLSDIREFAIPAGKVYLFPAVDCFDGMLVTWRISEHPNADLVNGMLDDVIANIGAKSKLIIHSYGSRMPLSLARLDRENGDKRIYQIHVTEGVLSR